MPRFIYTSDVERYDTKEEDIKIGDIRWINFPSLHRYDRLPNGDSERCIIHPGLVIDKIEGEKRCIKVVEISHRHTGYERQIGNTQYWAICDILAVLSPEHIGRKLYYIETDSDEFKDIIEYIKYVETTGDQMVLTQEQMFLMLSEEAEYGNNWFISEDDIYLNWDKWEDGSAHLVFVNGLSGSGKSTLGRKISENYDAYYVELDVYGWGLVGQKAVDEGRTNFDYIKEKDRKLYEYMKAKRIPPDIFAKIDKYDLDNEEDNEFKVREIEKYLYWLAFEQKERVVVEGGYTGVVMVRNPELWKDTPIIFKGTSVTKSVFRRMVRATKKDGPIGIIKVIKAIKPQYIDHIIPETNASRKAMLSGRDDWEYVKESFTQIEADKSPHTRKKKLDLRKIPTKIADFKDFLKKIKTPEMVMKWFLKVKVRWTPHGGSNDHPFQWPDWLIKQRMGNCFDQSIFLHYFCRAKHIDHKMYLVTWLADNGQGTGHAVPLYKKGDKVYVFAYLNTKMGFIGGPFRSYGEAKRVLDNYFLMYINQFFKAPSTPYSSYLSDDDLANFDKYYNNRKITQTEYIIEGLGKNMRSSHLFKIKVKGFAFPNPILPAYDCIIMVFRTISTIYNFFTANEEVDIDYGEDIVLTEEDVLLEESKYWNRSDFFDKSRKKKFDKIKDFNQFCKEIKSVEEALSYFILEKVVWSHESKKIIIWPDELIRTKTGVCFDHAIFFHYFCKSKKIESRICLMSWEGKEAWMFCGHAIPCFKRKDKIFAVIYFRPTLGWMAGPYDSWEECRDNIKQIHRGMVQYEYYHTNSHAYADYITEEGMKELDKIYGIPNISQAKFFCSNGFKPIRGTYFVKFRIKGFTFADPRFFAWDILTKMRDVLGITPWNEETTILEEKLSADERRCFGLPKKKKYPMPDEAHVRAAIRFFNHCDPEDEEELARNIKKYMKKYNMKDVNVSDNNRFKKYYHPEEKKPIEESQMTSKRNIFLTSAGLENDEVRQMFLSSYGKSIKESRVLYVTAAAIDKESIDYLGECWKDLLNVGINPNNIIEYNFDKHMDYDDFMKFDIVYVCGGDENHLIQVINKSGMRDNFILAINNGLVYIGVSAGACIASPYVDNGLNFIPNKVDVHYSKKESTRNGSLPPKHIQINLSNDQAIWINGNNAKIIGRTKDEMNNEAYLYMKPYISGAIKSSSMIKPVEESGIQKSGTYQDTVFVYNRLSDKEKSLLGRHHKDSPACVYRKVEYDGDHTPIGWIELYDSSKVAMMTNQEYDENIKDLNIGIAVDKEFRGKGVATKLLKSAVQFFKSSQYETLTYIVRDGNDRSEAFAKKCGFAYMWRRKKEHETIYMITNPTKMRNAINEAYLYIRASVNAARRSLGLLETSAAMGGPVVGMEINDQTVSYSNPGMFIIQYSDGNDTGYGITNDLKTKYFLRHDKKKNKLVKEDFSEFLKDKYFGIYSITQEHRGLWNNLLTSFYEDPKCLTEETRTLSLYEYFSGRRELVGDQIDYDENFNRVEPLWLDLMYNMKLQDPKMMNIPVINENYNGGDFRKHITLPQGIREFVSSSLHSNELILCEDPKGMYLLDENNNLVSRYITQEELEVINDGISG